MELLNKLALGFGVAFTITNVCAVLLGCALGTLIAALPGIGPVAAVAMLLPAVHALDATTAMILLAGVCYGAQYGRTTTSIVADVADRRPTPAPPLHGRQRARQGRAGAAFAVAVAGAFVAGCVGALAIALLVAPLTELAFLFGPQEYFALLLLGLVGAAVIAPGSSVKAIAMVVVGLLLAQVGTDAASGVTRYAFGIGQLDGGIGLIVVAMGVVVVADAISHLGRPIAAPGLVSRSLRPEHPGWEEARRAWPAIARGTSLGAVIGVLPGAGALLSSIAAYRAERRIAGAARRFGAGDLRGVAGPASAASAAVHTSFAPLLALGVPLHPVMALLVGAMLIKGIDPGPQVAASNPQFLWGLIASMWIGNVLLVMCERLLLGLRSRLLAVPYRLLAPAVALIACIGVYSVRGSGVDVCMTALLGLVGYALSRLGCEPAHVLLGFVVAPMLEGNLRQALLLSRGDWATFVDRPVSASLLAGCALMVAVASLPAVRKRREDAFLEE